MLLLLTRIKMSKLSDAKLVLKEAGCGSAAMKEKLTTNNNSGKSTILISKPWSSSVGGYEGSYQPKW